MKYDGRYVYDAWLDVPTPTMQLSGNILLNSIERQKITNMITGLTADQINTAFASMTADWKKNGGNKSLEEINA